eukprot:Pgem_evm1s4646
MSSMLFRAGRNALKVNIRTQGHNTARQSVRYYKAPLRDTKFLINQVFDFPTHWKNELKNEDATPEMLDMVLNECA